MNSLALKVMVAYCVGVALTRRAGLAVAGPAVVRSVLWAFTEGECIWA